MAKVYQLELDAPTQAQFDPYAHSLLFADSIYPHSILDANAGVVSDKQIIVTSRVDSTSVGTISNTYFLLADDSQSEVSIDISTGKFVEGNLIAVWCPTSEAQADLRDFMTFYASAGDIHLHVGVCNTTQSQDYTPDIVANSRAIKMLSPAQIQSLGL